MPSPLYRVWWRSRHGRLWRSLTFDTLPAANLWSLNPLSRGLSTALERLPAKPSA